MEFIAQTQCPGLWQYLSPYTYNISKSRLKSLETHRSNKVPICTRFRHGSKRIYRTRSGRDSQALRTDDGDSAVILK